MVCSDYFCLPGPSGCRSETGPCSVEIQVSEERVESREAWGLWEVWRSRAHRCQIYHRRDPPALRTLPWVTTATAAELGWSRPWTARLWTGTPSHLPDGGGRKPHWQYVPLALHWRHSREEGDVQQLKLGRGFAFFRQTPTETSRSSYFTDHSISDQSKNWNIAAFCCKIIKFE